MCVFVCVSGLSDGAVTAARAAKPGPSVGATPRGHQRPRAGQEAPGGGGPTSLPVLPGARAGAGGGGSSCCSGTGTGGEGGVEEK